MCLRADALELFGCDLADEGPLVVCSVAALSCCFNGRPVSMPPHPPTGGPATRELSFGELGSNRCDSSSPGPRTPEGTGGGWRVACGGVPRGF